ncbi:MAG: hypothetical protein AAF351_00965 [Pseudomonadota bacterium]
MARRKELANVVHGLYGSFISRNNDVDGYWGIGKLCAFASEAESGTVRIDLFSKTCEPATSEFQQLIEYYWSKLLSYPPSRFAVAAKIDINFEPPRPEEKRVPINTWGSLFELTVTITDDKGRAYSRSGHGRCAPHDPKLESRRSRPT